MPWVPNCYCYCFLDCTTGTIQNTTRIRSSWWRFKFDCASRYVAVERWDVGTARNRHRKACRWPCWHDLGSQVGNNSYILVLHLRVSNSSPELMLKFTPSAFKISINKLSLHKPQLLMADVPWGVPIDWKKMPGLEFGDGIRRMLNVIHHDSSRFTWESQKIIGPV